MFCFQIQKFWNMKNVLLSNANVLLSNIEKVLITNKCRSYKYKNSIYIVRWKIANFKYKKHAGFKYECHLLLQQIVCHKKIIREIFFFKSHAENETRRLVRDLFLFFKKALSD